MNAQNFLQHCEVEVWSAQYAVVKAKYLPDTFVAVFQDRQELTVVVEEKLLQDEWVQAVEKGWRMLSFRVTLPFELVGFLATISQALADAKVPIFALSAYSTDHLLVKQTDLPSAIHCLQSLGCVVKEIS